MYRIRALTTGRTIGICPDHAQASAMAERVGVSSYAAECVNPATAAPMTFLDEFNQYIATLSSLGGQLVLDEFFTIGVSENGEPEFTFREGQVAEHEGDPA